MTVSSFLPAYGSAGRRRTRAGLRLVAGLRHTRSAPVAAFWWDGNPNFGDALTPWLLPRLGVLPHLVTDGSAELTAVGSVLEMLPAEFSGAVWGSGLLRGRAHPLSDADYLAVRGPLTLELQDIRRPVAVGDPGLLVGRMIRRRRPRASLGVVAHHAHRHDQRWHDLVDATPGARFVDVQRPVPSVLADIASCSAVVTSSLHGLVIADSLGIPAVWCVTGEPLRGGRFKFLDYEAVVTPGRTRVAEDLAEAAASVRTVRPPSPDVVADVQHGLLEALSAWQGRR